MIYHSRRHKLEIMRAQLEIERSSFLSTWRDLADYYSPRKSRFTTTDVNKGELRNWRIVDTTPVIALRAFRAGMTSGISSPSRPWFRLTVPDPEIAEAGSVKRWLDDVTRRMRSQFLKSNIYKVLANTYGELGQFGTSAFVFEDDTNDVFRAFPVPIGSYSIATDSRGRVNTFYREMQMTVRQLIEKFGMDGESKEIDWSKFSPTVKKYYDMAQYDVWIQIIHAIVPNENYDPNSPLAKHKKFYSAYYESGYVNAQRSNYLNHDDGKVLRESGFDLFPVLCPRWEVTGEDSYATNCPGMEALGDVKQLQTMERRAAQAIEKMVNPPLSASVELKTSKTTILPGGITYMRDPSSQLRPTHVVDPRINELEQKTAQIRYRIDEAFYKNLFLMIANLDRRQITAREVDVRNEEKLLALGPALEQLNQDLLDPLIDLAFDKMYRAGLIPTPPPELQDGELKIEYVSYVAQAQKLIGLGALERLAGFVTTLGSVDPRVIDKINPDQMVDEYADVLGSPASVVHTDEEVEAIRFERAQAQQEQMRMQQLQAVSKSAKELSEANTGGQNALTQLLQSVPQ